MKIEHIALFTSDLERLRNFYVRYFGGTANEKYCSSNVNNKGFESYFIAFEGGAKLELMTKPQLPGGTAGEALGFSHIAFSVGSKEQVDALTAELVADGFPLVSAPRYTGDGCYESSVLDPDGNRVEITE